MLLSFRTHIFIITKTARWEVVKISASPKDLFVFFWFWVFHVFSRSFPIRNMTLHTFFHIHTYIFPFPFFSLRPHPPLIQIRGGGAYYPCVFIFLLGHIQVWPKRGGGHVPEMPQPLLKNCSQNARKLPPKLSNL